MGDHIHVTVYIPNVRKLFGIRIVQMRKTLIFDSVLPMTAIDAAVCSRFVPFCDNESTADEGCDSSRCISTFCGLLRQQRLRQRGSDSITVGSRRPVKDNAVAVDASGDRSRC